MANRMGSYLQKRSERGECVVQVIACAHGTICACVCVCLLKNAHSTVDLWSFEFLPGYFRIMAPSLWIGLEISMLLQKRCCDGVFRISCIVYFAAYFDDFQNTF